MGLETCQIFTTIKDFSLIGMIEPVDTIEKRGLPCAIRPDDGKYFTCSYLKTHVVQGLKSSKSEGEAINAYCNFIFVLSHQKTRYAAFILRLYISQTSLNG
jgi:hypothetical protein